MTEQQPRAQELPPGATPIDTEELLAAIGELYVQARVLRRVVATVQQQRQQLAPNGQVDALRQQ